MEMVSHGGLFCVIRDDGLTRLTKSRRANGWTTSIYFDEQNGVGVKQDYRHKDIVIAVQSNIANQTSGRLCLMSFSDFLFFFLIFLVLKFLFCIFN